MVFAVDPTLAFIGTFRDFQRLKLKYDKLLSNFAWFAFNCKVRHYSKEEEDMSTVMKLTAGPDTSVFFSLTSASQSV